MDPSERPTPSQLADFDQKWTEVNHTLDHLIDVHRAVLTEAVAAPEVDIVGLGAWLRDFIEHEAAAELLAAAIHRLVRNG